MPIFKCDGKIFTMIFIWPIFLTLILFDFLCTGGFETFSALYPFLRTQKTLYVPRELDALQCYPYEIIYSVLYMGDWTQGNAAYIQKDLKIKGHINCCVKGETL